MLSQSFMYMTILTFCVLLPGSTSTGGQIEELNAGGS